MQKAFKVTLIPNRAQAVLINKTIGCARFVYNRFLTMRKELYSTEKKTLNYGGCSQVLTQLKKELEWLREVDKFALQNSLKNLETAYKNFFADLKKPKAKRRFGFPKFKKKQGFKQSYKTNLTNGNIQILKNYLKLPKLGWVRFHESQEITGNIINVTVTGTVTGKYIASILCETEISVHPHATENVGLDLGIKSYLVTSTNEVVDNPKHYRTQQRKLRKASKNLSRCQKDSSNRVKAKIKLLAFTNGLFIKEKTFCTNSLLVWFEKMLSFVSRTWLLVIWSRTTNSLKALWMLVGLCLLPCSNTKLDGTIELFRKLVDSIPHLKSVAAVGILILKSRI